MLSADIFARNSTRIGTVLDLGCGYGEFINNITLQSQNRDGSEPGFAKARLKPTSTVCCRIVRQTWQVQDNS